MSVDDNHAEAIAYRYRSLACSTEYAERMSAMTTADLVAHIDAGDPLFIDWAAHKVLADRSEIAHDFERGYSADLLDRYNTVRDLNPNIDPSERNPDRFQDAYDAYADAHPDIPTPTDRALIWAREQITETH